MTENSSNLNIFEGAPALFRDALPLFTGLAGTVLPVRQEAAGEALLYTLSPVSEGGRPALAAFTGEGLLDPPLVRKSPADTAALFFHAPAPDLFIFNPAHPKARLKTSPLAASRRDISLLAGFLKRQGKAAPEDPAALAAEDFALGDLHAAHYLYDAAVFRNPASRTRFALYSVLIELGLLQEAYDSLKTDTDPEARLCLAVIHRKTGNAALARMALAPLDQSALQERKTLESAWLDLEEGREEEAEKAFQRLASSAFDKAEALSGLGAAMTKTAFRTKDKGRLSAAAAALRSALTLPSPASVRVYFQLGNLYFRSGDAAQAETCYRSSAALAPTVQALANLALTLIRTGKQAEAAAVTAQIALTDIVSAARLAASFPKESLAGLFQPAPLETPRPAPAAMPPPRPGGAAAAGPQAPPGPAAGGENNPGTGKDQGRLPVRAPPRSPLPGGARGSESSCAGAAPGPRDLQQGTKGRAPLPGQRAAHRNDKGYDLSLRPAHGRGQQAGRFHLPGLQAGLRAGGRTGPQDLFQSGRAQRSGEEAAP